MFRCDSSLSGWRSVSLLGGRQLQSRHQMQVPSSVVRARKYVVRDKLWLWARLKRTFHYRDLQLTWKSYGFWFGPNGYVDFAWRRKCLKVYTRVHARWSLVVCFRDDSCCSTCSGWEEGMAAGVFALASRSLLERRHLPVCARDGRRKDTTVQIPKWVCKHSATECRNNWLKLT